MVGIGVTGIGFMGMIHYLAAERASGAKVTALCSRSERKLAGDWTDIQGNFGPRGARMDLSGVAKYTEFEDLLADPNVQLVDLCVPNNDHARMAIRALEAGKDVLVEKPIAMEIRDADAMMAAARSSGRLLMVAHILPFFPEFEFVANLVREETYGRVLAAHFTRVISKPDWSAGVADFAENGGPALDLHIHDTHFIDLICGTPAAVFSRGITREGAVIHLATQYLYSSEGPIVSALSGALAMPGRPFTHGYEVYFEEATVAFQFENLSTGGRATPVTVIREDGSVEQPELGAGDPIDAFAREIESAARAVESREESPLLSGDRARRALRLCLAEIESVKSGRMIPLPA